jgi:hypothetical protein
LRCSFTCLHIPSKASTCLQDIFTYLHIPPNTFTYIKIHQMHSNDNVNIDDNVDYNNNITFHCLQIPSNAFKYHGMQSNAFTYLHVPSNVTTSLKLPSRYIHIPSGTFKCIRMINIFAWFPNKV